MLSGYTVSRAPEVNRKHTFKLYKYGLRTYYFQADSSKDMNRCVQTSCPLSPDMASVIIIFVM